MSLKEVRILVQFVLFVLLGASLAPQDDRGCVVSVKYLPVKTPIGGFRGHEDYLSTGDTLVIQYEKGVSIMSICTVEDTALNNTVSRLK